MATEHQQKIAVIGLGYVGLPFAAAMANVGFEVVGVDIDEHRIERLNNRLEVDMFEPGLQETLSRNRERLVFTSTYGPLRDCSAVFVCLGTGLNPSNEIDISQIESATIELGKVLRKGQLVVLRSTVHPGTTEAFALRLEELSGLVKGRDFFVAYAPERTIEGLALHELYTLPKIIGGIDVESTGRTARILARLGGEVIKVSSPAVAEFCKFVDNMYRALNIAFANEIALISEKINVDSYEVVTAVNRAYERTRVFKAGLGADGPCLTKDAVILSRFAGSIGVGPDVINACIRANQSATLRVADLVIDYVKRKHLQRPKISILGLAFKGYPETSDLRGSPAKKIMEILQKSAPEWLFSFYDPVVMRYPEGALAKSLDDCIDGSNVILLLTDHPQLKGLNLQHLVHRGGRPLLIVDCWHSIENPSGIEDPAVELLRIGDGTRRL
jgi:UDP-N-acetyl-D-mannosaminuronic acid dehydrogenase